MFMELNKAEKGNKEFQVWGGVMCRVYFHLGWSERSP